MYEKSLTHRISKIVVDVLFYLSILCTLTVPFTARGVFEWIKYPSRQYFTPFTVMLFLSGVACVYILFQLKQMYKTLLVGNPFVDENVSHFRKMAVTCSFVALIYIIKSVVMFTIATVIIAIIFVVGTLFCLTLKDLFKQAINYKNENELTI